MEMSNISEFTALVAPEKQLKHLQHSLSIATNGKNNNMLTQQSLERIPTNTKPIEPLNSSSLDNENCLIIFEELLLQGKHTDFKADSLQVALTPTPLDPSIGGSINLGAGAGFQTKENFQISFDKNNVLLAQEGSNNAQLLAGLGQNKTTSTQVGVGKKLIKERNATLAGTLSCPPPKLTPSPIGVMDYMQNPAKQGGLESMLLQSFRSSASSTNQQNTTKEKKKKGPGGSFARQVFKMLSDLEKQDRTDIASFLPHGRAFSVHKPEDFVKEVMPKYFRMSQFASFQRQLNLYGFQKMKEGPDRGAYHHEYFVRGQEFLCSRIRRKEQTTKKISARNGHDNFDDVFF